MSNSKIFEQFNKMLDEFKENPEKVTANDENKLKAIFFKMFEPLKFSQHSAWRVEWTLEKRHNAEDEKPYETLGDVEYFKSYEKLSFAGNVILDNGANEMLKLLIGDSSATKFDNANAKIYVGTDTTPENASQTGVLATSGNKTYASMNSGYPIVSGRTAIFRADFGNDVANFAWNEASLTNGTGVGSVALNRKVSSMGTKNGGTWTLQIQVSLVSA